MLISCGTLPLSAVLFGLDLETELNYALEFASSFVAFAFVVGQDQDQELDFLEPDALGEEADYRLDYSAFREPAVVVEGDWPW
jgi:hypothetical protein